MAEMTPENLIVRFFMHRQRNNFRSDIEGREIIDEVECIEIRIRDPKFKDNVVRQVTDEDRRRFADIYARWKQQQAAPLTGTPLSDWPGVTVSFVEEMAELGIRSVEQLAALDEELAAINPTWSSQRNRAQGWLDQAAGSASRETLNRLVSALPKTRQVASVLKSFGLDDGNDEAVSEAA